MAPPAADPPAGPADHFSSVAAHYAAFRPRYPAALFDWLASLAPGRRRAWDCACGSGQATIPLAGLFDSVIATDLSAEQIAEATRHERVTYRVATAEASGLADRSVDLVMVAQALHWFDVDRFYAEARRVLAPSGVLAAVSYAPCAIDAAAGDAALQHHYTAVVGPYWPAERRHVEEGYRDLRFPEPRIPAPALSIEVDWTLPELLGYVRSWSSTARYVAVHRVDPTPALERAIAPGWGAPERRHRVRWPLTVLAWQAPAA